MSDIKTVAIIGGGVSGLAAGVALSRQGLRVQLFEARDKVGGCCATTTLQGYTFNDGAMYLAVPELLDRAFERLGLDRARSVPLRPIVAPSCSTMPDGTAVTIATANEIRVDGVNGAARTARLRSEIDALMNKWRPVLRLFADELLTEPFSASRLLHKGWRHLHKLRGTVAAELQRTFSDPATRAAMSGVLLYTGLDPQRAPVISLVGLVALLDSGFFLPEGGMGAIPRALGDALTAAGGEIFTGTTVERIRVSRGRVFALDVRGRGTIPVDAVISTVSGMLTFGSLLDAEHVPASLQRKVRHAPLSHRALGIQLGLWNRLPAHSHSISTLPWLEQQHQLLNADGAAPRLFNYTVPTVTMPELAPAGCSIVEMFSSIDQTWSVDRWTQDTKESIADATIAALSRVHDLEIVVRRVTTPKDYRDSMRLFGGAVYGLSPAAGPGAQFAHRTPIEGLFQAGQTTYPGFGVSTSMLSGIFAADALANGMPAP